MHFLLPGLAPRGQLSTQTSFFIIRPGRKTNQDQVSTPRRVISDPLETQTDLGPNSPFPTVSFTSLEKPLSFPQSLFPFTKGRTAYFSRGLLWGWMWSCDYGWGMRLPPLLASLFPEIFKFSLHCPKRRRRRRRRRRKRIPETSVALEVQRLRYLGEFRKISFRNHLFSKLL